MTDQEWLEIRERWKAKVKDGDLLCDENMIPYVLDKYKEPYAWVSRQFVENLNKYCEQPEFKKSAAEALARLNDIPNQIQKYREEHERD
jgi:hypothetical protein